MLPEAPSQPDADDIRFESYLPLLTIPLDHPFLAGPSQWPPAPHPGRVTWDLQVREGNIERRLASKSLTQAVQQVQFQPATIEWGTSTTGKADETPFTPAKRFTERNKILSRKR